MDNSKSALIEYELNLKSNPNRFNGIYGAAIAAKQSGNNEKASQYYNQLLIVAENSNSNRQELNEAKEFIEKSS